MTHNSIQPLKVEAEWRQDGTLEARLDCMERPYLRSPSADEQGQHNAEYDPVKNQQNFDKWHSVGGP